jgi:hypothetical protein
MAQALRARRARFQVRLRHLRGAGARGGRELPRGTFLGRRAERPPGHRNRLALGSGRRVHPRLACLSCLPKEDLCPGEARPYWLRAERSEEIAFGLTDYDVPVELLDADVSGPEELVAVLDAETARG